jgi:hypothetical protein
MATSRCPHCGAEYDTNSISTYCASCLKPLAAAEQEATGAAELGVPGGPPPIEMPQARAPVAPTFAAPAAPIGPVTAPAAPAPSPVLPLPVAPPTAAPIPDAAAAVAPTPASQRRPCVKCGEALYTTEVTCWRCGAAQSAAAQPSFVGVPGAAAIPGAAPGYVPPPGAPYGAPAPLYVASDEAQNRGNISLVLGIVGLLTLFCLCGIPGIIIGPIAIWLGASARREGATGTATGGLICGIIATILGLIGAAALAAMWSAGYFASPMATGTTP